MKRKWYLQTWFICLLFAFWFCIIPGIAGLVLLILQIVDDSNVSKKYGIVGGLNDHISTLNNHISTLNNRRDSLDDEIARRNSIINDLGNEISQLKSEISNLELNAICTHYRFSDFDGLSSEECRNRLAALKNREKAYIKANDAFVITSHGTKKEINDNCKQILRCFNAECDNAFLALKVKKIDSIREKIVKSFETLNKIFAVDGIQLKQELLELKLDELNLVYTSELKKEQEAELQRAIREQMLEEEKVRKEIERQKAKIEKDQAQHTNEINRLMQYLQNTSDSIEKQLYIDKIRELEERLKQLEAEKDTVLEREANAKAGYVYIISNIGSFGKDIYKIGMTRRLEPMDRVKELSSASVPFEFDVHAMIFSNDAPALESALHTHFQKQRVNLVNPRKEFFNVSIGEIEEVVKSNFNNTAVFTKVPVAREYYETLNLRSR